ncbi:hypothetical protein PV762_02245 [Mitsuaria sp. CC2]|uniref:hypothetical protein n=1 Tax=Mitsuaria sp. CC2 TaxID=3029186 RepID=UPI003B8C7D49
MTLKKENNSGAGARRAVQSRDGLCGGERVGGCGRDCRAGPRAGSGTATTTTTTTTTDTNTTDTNTDADADADTDADTDAGSGVAQAAQIPASVRRCTPTLRASAPRS